MELRWNMEGGYMEEKKRGREEGKSSSSSFGWGGRGIKSIFEKKNHWGEFRVWYGNRYCHASIVISTTEPAFFYFFYFYFYFLAVWYGVCI